uniref:Ciliary microtubule associated protein 1B n=1 Tax=Cyclopterus lumpus TaxID=8103 RepID=A0A8C2WUW9_CYCLU
MGRAWVGTWRPHKPRGPIAALYGSPGPKYALPGLTGKYSPEHSERVLFHTAPAYTLSGRSKDISNIQTPGPASYSLPQMLGSNTVVTSAAPTFSFCGRNTIGTFHEDLKKTPGPAAYNTVDACIYRHKPPQFSMKGRNFPPGETTKKPGPGAHYPDYSFGLRHSEFISPLFVDVAE